MKNGIHTIGFFDLINFCPYCKSVNAFNKSDINKIGICMDCNKQFKIK